MLYARQQQLDRASNFLEKAVVLRPDYPDALNNLGVLLVREEHTPEAKEKFETCIRVAPGFDQAYLNLARLYVLLNDKEKAREILQASIAPAAAAQIGSAGAGNAKLTFPAFR